jgi:hypothetical protein
MPSTVISSRLLSRPGAPEVRGSIPSNRTQTGSALATPAGDLNQAAALATLGLM